MILVELEAVNFGKYRRLALRDIPAGGLVGVVGPNESGKTTIGDAVCFALFGRTASDRVPEEHIHWKHDEMRLRLDFLDAEGHPWRITREVDRSGTYAATLGRLDATDEVRGVGKVGARVEELLRLDFDEFVYAFFLAQKELDGRKADAASSRRHVVDELTGVGTIERATDAVSDELDELIRRRGTLTENGTVARLLLEEFGGRRRPDDGAAADVEALAAREAALDASVTDETASLERVEVFGRSVDRLRNYLGLLKARTYAYVLGGRKAWLEELGRRLGDRLADLEKQRSSFTEVSARREAFRRKLGELAGLVHMRHNQIKRALENRLPGDIPEDDEDLVTPDGKIEQLVLTRLRSRREGDREGARGRDFRWLVGGLLAVFALTAACHVWRAALGSLVPFYAGAAATLVLLSAAWRQHMVVRRIRDRQARLGEAAERLERDVTSLREAARLCEEFDTDRLDGLGDRLARMGGGVLSEFHAELEGEYADLLTGPSSEYLKSARGADRIDAQLGELHEDLAEVRHAAMDLETWLGRFSGSPFFKSETTRPVGEVMFERAAFRAAAKALTREVEGCQKTLFALESDCRSPVSPRICSSWRDFEDTLDELARHEGAPHKVALEPLRAIGKGAYEGLDDPLDALWKAEQRLGAFCPGRDALVEQAENLRSALAGHRDELGRVRMERQAAEERLARVEPDAARCRQLEEELSRSGEELASVERGIRVREILLELLTGLSERMRQRLGPALADYMRFVLPRITGNRYREVRLTEDLAVEVWSPEKGDYVHLDALSGGTVDQLLVSLRLAFAKALMDTTMVAGERQYLFFDEPLASFDRSRGEAFLSLLRSFGGTFAQVFLVSHLGGLEELFDAVVETSVDLDELDVSFAATAPEALAAVIETPVAPEVTV